MDTQPRLVRLANSFADDGASAIDELHHTLNISESAFTLFFCSPKFCQQDTAKAIRQVAGKSLVLGCSSAGEINPAGYTNHSISAISFDRSHFKVGAEMIGNIKDFSADQAASVVTSLKDSLTQQGVTDFFNCFALLLVDGTCMAEESMTYRLQEALGEIPLIGGSAGDDLRFRQTFVFLNHHFANNAAVLAIIWTQQPWEVFKFQHFKPTQKRVVVTAADPENRVVKELNGDLAAVEYARLLGLPSSEHLTQAHLNSHPLTLMMGDSRYIRSPHEITPEGYIKLFCAIDEGLVLSVGEAVSITDELKENFAEVQARVGRVQATIACDCIQRRLELEAAGKLAEASQILSAYNTIGFSTYGEQFGSQHINQTLTGVVIG